VVNGALNAGKYVGKTVFQGAMGMTPWLALDHIRNGGKGDEEQGENPLVELQTRQAAALDNIERATTHLALATKPPPSNPGNSGNYSMYGGLGGAGIGLLLSLAQKDRSVMDHLIAALGGGAVGAGLGYMGGQAFNKDKEI
jgi:hypothetical protein